MARLPQGAPGGGERLLVVMAESVGNVTYASDDGGETWAPIGQPPPPYVGVVLVPLGGRSVAVLLKDLGIYESSDGGATWTSRGLIPGGADGRGSPRWGSRGLDGRLYVGGARLAADTETQGFTWRTADAYAVAASGTPEAGAFAVTVRPNPGRGTFTVRIRRSQPGPLRAEVFDAVGRRVRVLADGDAPAARTLRLDASEWSPGLYLVRTTSGDEVRTRRFVVLP